MNHNDWMSEVRGAYTAASLSLGYAKEQALLLDGTHLNAAQQELKDEVVDVMFRRVLQKAELGQTFGPVDRVRQRFRRSLEENYGVTDGVFLNVAKAYWTFQLEVGDLVNSPCRASLLAKALAKVEFDFASVFFPTPGPASVDLAHRIQTQRTLLTMYAPSINAADFIAQNPLLKSATGCMLGLATLALAGAAIICVVFLL